MLFTGLAISARAGTDEEAVVADWFPGEPQRLASGVFPTLDMGAGMKAVSSGPESGGHSSPSFNL
jgi:hypothetical protein